LRRVMVDEEFPREGALAGGELRQCRV
jgi:hypothetical protein